MTLADRYYIEYNFYKTWDRVDDKQKKNIYDQRPEMNIYRGYLSRILLLLVCVYGKIYQIFYRKTVHKKLFFLTLIPSACCCEWQWFSIMVTLIIWKDQQTNKAAPTDYKNMWNVHSIIERPMSKHEQYGNGMMEVEVHFITFH